MGLVLPQNDPRAEVAIVDWRRFFLSFFVLSCNLTVFSFFSCQKYCTRDGINCSVGAIGQGILGAGRDTDGSRRNTFQER